MPYKPKTEWANDNPGKDVDDNVRLLEEPQNDPQEKYSDSYHYYRCYHGIKIHGAVFYDLQINIVVDFHAIIRYMPASFCIEKN